MQFKKIIQDFRFIALIYILCVIVISIQKIIQDNNNFGIFQHSVIHFFQRLNMYIEYPKEHRDVFLYNPSFAVLFAPFGILPKPVGMTLWIAFSAFLFFITVRMLPLNDSSKVFIYYFTLIELVTALERCQTNPMIAILIMLAFISLENGHPFKATLFTNLGFFIKGYGAVSGIFYFLKKPNIRTFLYLAFWFLIIFALPLVYYSPKGLINLYQQWTDSLLHKFDKNSLTGGVSLMGILVNLIKVPVTVKSIEIAGLVILLLTTIYLAIRRNYEQVKWLMLAYILIWVIIFNHAAESSTYVIAISGVAIWYLVSPQGYIEKALLILTFILTVLSPTDIFPDYLREKFVKPYALKALGPSLIWIYIQLSFFLPKKLVANEPRI
jgi:Glycosyltransferase family 87